MLDLSKVGNSIKCLAKSVDNVKNVWYNAINKEIISKNVEKRRCLIYESFGNRSHN